MKQRFLLPLTMLVLIGCTQVPSETDSAETDATAADAPAGAESVETTAAAPEIGTFTFDEIDIRGCGMSLWGEGNDPREDGIYLFNGIIGANPNNDATDLMRMKIDGEIMAFERTEGSGEEFYGQYEFQSFAGPNGETTVTVLAEQVAEGPDPEVSRVEGSITVNRDGNETTVDVVGDAGC